jgi:hypothetical protein
MWTTKLPEHDGYHWIRFNNNDSEELKTSIGYLDVKRKLINIAGDFYSVNEDRIKEWWSEPLVSPDKIYCDDGYRKIEILFPFPVDITRIHESLITLIIDDICKNNCPPDCVMWLGGVGCKPTYIPITREEELKRGIEFDRDILCFEVDIKKKYEEYIEHPQKRILDELLEVLKDLKEEDDLDVISSLEKIIIPRIKLREKYSKIPKRSEK